MDHRRLFRCLKKTLLWVSVMVISVLLIYSGFDLPENGSFQVRPKFHISSGVRNVTVTVQTMFSGTTIAGLEAQMARENATSREKKEISERNISFSSTGSNTSSMEASTSELFPNSELQRKEENSTNSSMNPNFRENCWNTTPITGSVESQSISVQNSQADQKSNSPVSNSMNPKNEANEELLKKDSAVTSFSDMNSLFLHSFSFAESLKPKWSSPADEELQQAKKKIQNSNNINNDPNLYPPLYRNLTLFQRSYELMEKMLKVYVYKEGEKPIIHQPVLQGIYASEGWFMKLLESSEKFVTRNPKEAHLFYLPFSSRNLEEYLYVPGSNSMDNLSQYLNNYLDIIVSRHNFWNRTEGADHFFVACHDWAPTLTSNQMSNCIRALCNSDIKERFSIGKDVSLPETKVRSPKHLRHGLGGKPASQRSILAFFAGRMHGYLRPILLQNWVGKDPDMKIYGQIPKTPKSMSYEQHMKNSKYCICAKGYEVNSPRVVEAIFYECVPVIISDNFVPPFFSILNWESFAVFVLEKDIPNLKKILVGISDERYVELQIGVKKVQQHFVWNSKPVKYDLFHMILHSIWYSRVLRA